MGKISISPYLEAVVVGKASPGNLLLFKGRPESPALVVGEEGKYLLFIGKKTSVVKTENYANSIALRVSGKWRFKLKSVDASAHKPSPFDVAGGLIALSPQGRYFVSVNGVDPFHEELLVNLDTLDLVPIHEAGSATCFPTDWAIELQEDEGSKWEVIFDPDDYAGSN